MLDLMHYANKKRQERKMLNKENTHDACKASQVLEDKVV